MASGLKAARGERIMDQQVNEQNLRFINDVMNSWAVQAVIVALLVGLALVAFGRASRILDDRQRRAFRVVVVVLIVVVATQAAVTAALGHIPLPILVVVEWVGLCGLWVYYVYRLLTGWRRGPGDAEAQRRGGALDETISRMEQERAAEDGTAPLR
jgi:hypothetical protein